MIFKQKKPLRTDLHRLNLNDTHQRYIARMGIYTVDDLYQRTPEEISRFRGVGKKSLQAITKAMDEWAIENNLDISNTPYHTKISNRIKPLIQEFPPKKESQYDESIYELKLQHTTKQFLEKNGVKTIYDLVLFNDDELIQTVGLTKSQREDVHKALKDFRDGVRQPIRLGSLYPFSNSGLYERDIQVLILSEYTEDALIQAGIQQLGDLSQYTAEDLLSVQGVGQVRVDEIIERYRNYKHGTVYINPNDNDLPQSLDDPLNQFSFDTRSENGLKRLGGYDSGELTIREFLNTPVRTLEKIRDFGQSSILLIMDTIDEWAELFNIDTREFIFLMAYTQPTSVNDQLYRLDFTNKAFEKLQEWNTNEQTKIIDLLNTPISVLLEEYNTLPSVAGRIVGALYEWCKEQGIEPVGYELFKNDYLHQGVEKYLKSHPVWISGKKVERKVTVKRIETPTDKGLITEVLLVVRYNNHTHRISKGNELVEGYPIHFSLLEQLD